MTTENDRLDDDTERLMLDYCAAGRLVLINVLNSRFENIHVHQSEHSRPGSGLEYENAKAALRARIRQLQDEARNEVLNSTDAFLRSLDGELSHEGQAIVEGYLRND